MKDNTPSRPEQDWPGKALPTDAEPRASVPDASMEDLPSGECFPKLLRLRSNQEFAAVFAAQNVVSDHVLVIHARATKLPWIRLGLSVSKRAGNAPQRNKWKRLIREAFRRQRTAFPAGLDIVVRPRKGSQPEYTIVASSLRKLVMRLEKQLRKTKTDRNE